MSTAAPRSSPRPVPAPTTLLGHFQLLFHYDLWACRLLLEALTPLPSGSHRLQGSVLMAHLIWANELWYGRVRGTEAGAENVPGDAPLSEMERRFQEVNRRWRELLALLGSENALATPVHYTATEGTQHVTPLRDVLTHVLHHGSHHRAQIATAVRNAGAEPPPSDYIFYHRALQEGTAELVEPS